jgi:hypothetical protein
VENVICLLAVLAFLRYASRLGFTILLELKFASK